MLNILLIPSERIEKLNQLSINTRRRCEAGIREWHRDECDFIIVTGGLFLPSTEQTRPASLIMKDWLTERGIPKRSILTETESLDSYQNISSALEILNKLNKPYRITILTQYQHLIRFFLIFLLGHHVVRGVRYRWLRQPEMRWSEWLFEWLVLIPYHCIDWRGTLWPATHNRFKRQANTLR